VLVPLSDTNPKVEELNKAQVRYKKWTNQTKINKKYFFTGFGFSQLDEAAKEPWTSMNNLLSEANADPYFKP
jgi:hypothetical protein